MKVIKGYGKVIGKLLLILLILLILTVAGMFIYRRVNLSKNTEFMKEHGFYNPVSVGDYSVNLLRTGSENGAHRIIVLSGGGPCCYF